MQQNLIPKKNSLSEMQGCRILMLQYANIE